MIIRDASPPSLMETTLWFSGSGLDFQSSYCNIFCLTLMQKAVSTLHLVCLCKLQVQNAAFSPNVRSLKAGVGDLFDMKYQKDMIKVSQQNTAYNNHISSTTGCTRLQGSPNGLFSFKRRP